LSTLFDQSFFPEEELVVQRRIHKIPRMRMKGVEPTEAALEFPSFHLEPGGQRGGDEVSFLQLDAVLGHGDGGVEIEVGIHRSEKGELRAFEIESFVKGFESGDISGCAPRFQLLLG
jgi:hypothetical protein